MTDAAKIARGGFKQYLIEQQAAAESARRADEIVADRERRRRRREQLRERLEAKQPEAPFAWGVLVLGIAIGLFL